MLQKGTSSSTPSLGPFVIPKSVSCWCPLFSLYPKKIPSKAQTKHGSLQNNNHGSPPKQKRKNREEPKRLPRKEARPWFPQKATHPCESEPPISIGTAPSRPMRPAASPGAPQMRRSPFWTVFALDVAVWRCVFFLGGWNSLLVGFKRKPKENQTGRRQWRLSQLCGGFRLLFSRICFLVCVLVWFDCALVSI